MSNEVENGVEVPAPAGGQDDEEAVSPSDPESPNKQEVTNSPLYSAGIQFQDHFSLRQPASQVRFRSRQVRVFDLVNDQLQLEHRVMEEEGNATAQHVFTMKRMRVGSFGLRAIRTIYTLVAFLMLGMLAVFSTQVLLMTILEIPGVSGVNTTNELNGALLISTTLSLPLLLYSLASLMVFATAFVCDQWNGHALFGTMTGWSKFAVEWLCVVLYLIVPAISGIVTLFLNYQNAWEITALVWFASMSLSFVGFAALVFYHEIKTCWDLIQIQYPGSSTVELVQKGVMFSLSHRFCGTRELKYLVQGKDDPDNLHEVEPVTTMMGLYSRTTALSCNPFFDQLDPPERRYTVEEIRDIAPIVTHQSW